MESDHDFESYSSQLTVQSPESMQSTTSKTHGQVSFLPFRLSYQYQVILSVRPNLYDIDNFLKYGLGVHRNFCIQISVSGLGVFQ